MQLSQTKIDKLLNAQAMLQGMIESINDIDGALIDSDIKKVIILLLETVKADIDLMDRSEK